MCLTVHLVAVQDFHHNFLMSREEIETFKKFKRVCGCGEVVYPPQEYPSVKQCPLKNNVYRQQ